MFEVQWSTEAKGQLADLWVKASNRNRITAAVESIDRALRSNPGTEGESREGDERVLILSTLVVDFRVSDDDRRVQVLAVRQVRERPRA